MDDIKVACVLLTLNEEAGIEECLTQFRPHVDYILVLDGGSTDSTVKKAEQIADKVIIKSFSGSFADEKNYARTKVPKDCLWIAWVDVDEKWDPGALKLIKIWIRDITGGVGAIRFPRINLPDGKDYPDYQIRVFPNSQDIEWKGKTHEVPYHKKENKPLDKLDKRERDKILPIYTADAYPIIHFPRRKDLKREWW